MDNEIKLQKIKERWNDLYFIKLGIVDHILECLWLYQNEYKPNKHYNNLYKELADLYILLKIFFEEGTYNYFYNDRINRFLEKIKGDSDEIR